MGSFYYLFVKVGFESYRLGEGRIGSKEGLERKRNWKGKMRKVFWGLF